MPIPPHLLHDLRDHIATDPASLLVFTNGLGRPLTRGGFRTTWVRARERPGLPDFRFHDLRHTGNTLAAAPGACTRELLARMGHASMRTALLYQHAAADRDGAIGAALPRLATGLVDDAGPIGHPGPPLRALGRARPRAPGT